MTTKSRSDRNVIFVQYCRSCDTHSWCTHHDEAKYHDTFLKFCDLCATYLPTFEVIGNMVPTHLIPFKIAENKYIDSKTNKYVVYPQIGSFQVRFAGQTVFSKKQSHSWPNLATVISQINRIADPSSPSPKIQKTSFEDKQTIKNSTNNSFLDSTDQLIAGTSIQSKGFTLTDHFKMYRPKNKFQEKDYLTEKPDSEVSYKQFSDIGPMQNRDRSEEAIGVKDLLGETKLKEMLRTRGLMLKQQGRKEMIIKLDSIEEQNAMIEDGLAATQRTQQKNVKKNNKMQQFQEQMSSLENKFINFENRVQDIQARGREFEYKNEPSDEKNKIKQLIEGFKREDRPIRREIDLKDKGLLMDKTNKLQQYLSYNQHERNQKLHRIYGEWKLIKQFSNKNRRLLKKKDRTSQADEEDSSQEDNYSQAHSQSPLANVLTFKPKLDKSVERRPKNLVMGQQIQQPKYSTKEKQVSKDYIAQLKGKTEQNFYKGKFAGLRSKMQSQQTDMQPTTTTKLVKKSLNTMSMDALRSIAGRKSNLNNTKNLEGPQIDKNNFSKNVKADIQKISNRINNIQEQLRKHKDWKESSPPPNNHYDNHKASRKQNTNALQSEFSLKEAFKYYGGFQKDSNSSKHTLSNISSKQRFSNFSQFSQARKRKLVQKQDSMIKQESEPLQSNQASKYYNISDKSEKNDNLKHSKSKNSKETSNKKPIQQRWMGTHGNLKRQQTLQIGHNSADSYRERSVKQTSAKKTSNHSGSVQYKQNANKLNKKDYRKIETSTNTAFIDKNSTINHSENRQNSSVNKISNIIKDTTSNNKSASNLQKYKVKPNQKPLKAHRNQQERPAIHKEVIPTRNIQKQPSRKLQIINHKPIVFRPKKIKQQTINQIELTPQKISATHKKQRTPNRKQLISKISTPQRRKSPESEAQIDQIQKSVEKPQFGKIKKNNKPKGLIVQHNCQGESILAQKQQNIENESQQQVKGTNSQQITPKTLGFYKVQGLSFNAERAGTQRNRNRSEKASFNKQIIMNIQQQRPQTQKKEVNQEGQQLAQPNPFDNQIQASSQSIHRGVEGQQQQRQDKQEDDEMLGEQGDSQEENEQLQSEEDRQMNSQNQVSNASSNHELSQEQNQDAKEQNCDSNDQKQGQIYQNHKQNVSLQSEIIPDYQIKYQINQAQKSHLKKSIESTPQIQANVQYNIQETQYIYQKQLQKQNRPQQDQDQLQKQIYDNNQTITRENSKGKQTHKKIQQTQKQASSEQLIKQKSQIFQNKTKEVCDEQMQKIAALSYSKFLQIKIAAQITKQMVPKERSEANIQVSEIYNLSSQQSRQMIAKNQIEVALTFSEYQLSISQSPLLQQAVQYLQQQEQKSDQKEEGDSSARQLKKVEVDPSGNVIDQYMSFICQVVLQTILSEQFQQEYVSVQKQSQVFELKQQNQILQQNLTIEKQKESSKSEVKKKVKKSGKICKNRENKIVAKENYQNNQKQVDCLSFKNVQGRDIEKQGQLISGSPNQILPTNIYEPVQSLTKNNQDHIQRPNSQKYSEIAQSYPNQTQIPHQSLPSRSPCESKQNLIRNKKSVLSSFKLEDNVYSQPKDNKFKQIGVQKQLTNQVSIQTELPSYTQQQALGVTKNGPRHPIQEDSLMINTHRLDQIGKVFSPSKSQFEGTVRNNFLSQCKKIEVSGKRSNKQALRARIIDRIYSRNKAQQTIKFQNIINGCDQDIIREEGSVTKLTVVYSGGVLLNEKNLQLDLVTTRFTKLLKIIEIISQKGQWLLTRLFQNAKGILKDKPVGVWLCKDYQWQCFVLDDNIKVDSEGNPLYTIHRGNQMWINFLQKAMTYALGGYEELQKADSTKLFTMLTGCNSINVRVKEDPLKNIKVLQLITECQRKNYIVHAEKNWDKIRQDKGRQSIYYVLSVRKANADEENLIELSQDGRQSFWVRLSKFVQEFSRVEILQLRINHNFAHIDLGEGNHGQISVVQLDFFQQGQGCVTLSYLSASGPLRAFLYREQKSKVLKLVGQAKQKQKSSLFFQCSFSEGRYYVFAQTEDRPARLSYLGEGQPSLKITEEIHRDSLKNQVAEYLPVNEQLRGQRSNDMGDTLNSFKASKARLRDNFMQSRLRENFVDYVLSRSRQVPESRMH